MFEKQIKKLGDRIVAKLREKAAPYADRAAVIGDDRKHVKVAMMAISETLNAVADAIQESVDGD